MNADLINDLWMGSMGKDEFVWRLYESERDFIKHHENQRTNASSILAAVAAALIVAISSDFTDGLAKMLVASTLAFVGFSGSIFSGKLYELIQLHASRSYEFLKIANESYPDIHVKDIKDRVKESQKIKFPFFAKRSLNRIWFTYHIIVMILGICLTGITASEYFGLIVLER